MTIMSPLPGQRPKARVRLVTALTLAWFVEIIAVGMGLLLALYAGREGAVHHSALGVVVAVMPFLALAVIELTKIPLVALAFRVRWWGWRLIAVIALLTVTVATWENFVFGFERGFSERVQRVEAAEHVAATAARNRDAAATALADLEARRDELLRRIAEIGTDIERDDTRGQQDLSEARRREGEVERARQDRDAIQRQRGELDREQAVAVANERRRCRVEDGRVTGCNPTAVTNSYNTRRAELDRRLRDAEAALRAAEEEVRQERQGARERRDVSIARRDAARQELEGQHAVVRQSLAAAQSERQEALDALGQAERDLRQRIDESQLHRIAMMVFGSHDRQGVETVKQFFVVSLAAIVALIGTVIAVLYYASQRRQDDFEEFDQPISFATDPETGQPVAIRDRLKLVYVPTNASEEEIAQARAVAIREAAP